jgi:hypothetical protein
MYCCNNGDAIASAKTYTNATGSTVIARILQAFYINFAIKNPKTTIIDHAIKTFHNLKWQISDYFRTTSSGKERNTATPS